MPTENARRRWRRKFAVKQHGAGLISDREFRMLPQLNWKILSLPSRKGRRLGI